MTASLRARIAALSDAEPELAGLLSVRGVLIAMLDGARIGATPPLLPAERVRAKLARGIPLLDGEAIPIPGSLLPLFEKLAVALLADPASAPSVEAILTVVRTGRLSAEQVLAEALAGHADHLESLAEAADVEAIFLDTLTSLAVRPLLVALAARLQPALAFGTWTRGYCPVCADFPFFGVEQPSGTELQCGRCLTAWAWSWPSCPFEPVGELTVFGTMTIDSGERWSIARCSTCQRYLKLSHASQATTLTEALFADLATWRMDQDALHAGLRRPEEPGYRLELPDLDGETDDDGFDDA
jgi:formate dehydrogenase maturation protein FdhE